MKCREATEAGADGVVPEQNPATSSFGTTPPARPFWNLMASQAPLLTQEGNFKTRPANSFTPSCARVYTLTPFRGCNSDALRAITDYSTADFLRR